MTEILFYHLKGQTPEQVLPALLQKSLERGWRVVVQASSDERVEALDAHLWTWRDDSFLPHGTWRDAEAAEQPIVLTAGDENPNGATVRFLVDGANLAANCEPVTSASCCCSTATIRMRSRRRGRAGARPKPPAPR